MVPASHIFVLLEAQSPRLPQGRRDEDRPERSGLGTVSAYLLATLAYCALLAVVI
jgi:hypothetical protein